MRLLVVLVLQLQLASDFRIEEFDVLFVLVCFCCGGQKNIENGNSKLFQEIQSSLPSTAAGGGKRSMFSMARLASRRSRIIFCKCDSLRWLRVVAALATASLWPKVHCWLAGGGEGGGNAGLFEFEMGCINLKWLFFSISI